MWAIDITPDEFRSILEKRCIVHEDPVSEIFEDDTKDDTKVIEDSSLLILCV